jgi:hypothetical protein
LIPDHSSDEKVKLDITKDGVALPSVRQGKELQKVLKVRFSSAGGVPIPDPWLLAAKASFSYAWSNAITGLHERRGRRLQALARDS